MIRIFNYKLKREILLDESKGHISLHPRQYDDDNPHVLLEIRGVHLANHAQSCSDCGAFVSALGTRSHDWFIDINGKVERLNLYGLGNEPTDNRLKSIISYYFTGTKLKLNIDTDTIESLQDQLNEHISTEEFEQCCYFRDKIQNLKDELGSS